MLSSRHVAAAVLAAVLCCGGHVLADDTHKGAECAEGAAAKQCPLAACETKQVAHADALLAKWKTQGELSAEDAKTVREARATLTATCPVGNALTGSYPAILASIKAIRSIDAALADGGKSLPADCQSEKGGCAFCQEVGAKMPAETMAAMMVAGKAIARAEQLALALQPVLVLDGGACCATAAKGSAAAADCKEGEAGCAHACKGTQVATKACLEGLKGKVDAHATTVAAGFEKAKTLAPAEGQKIEAAVQTIDKLDPSRSMNLVFSTYMAMVSELKLAGDAMQAAGTPFDAATIEALSPNAKNAYALFGARAQLIGSLAALGNACMQGCGGEGSCEQGGKDQAAAGCEANCAEACCSEKKTAN